MHLTKPITLLGAVAVSIFPILSHAEVLPLAVDVSAGTTQVEYKEQKETGITWSINARYQVAPMSSIYTGYSETSADLSTDANPNTTFKSYTVPVGLRFDVPLVIGDTYLRGGGEYYSLEHGTDSEKGWGYQLGFGYRLGMIVGPSLGFEVLLSENDDITTTTFSLNGSVAF